MVLAFPPISGVRGPSARTLSMARITSTAPSEWHRDRNAIRFRRRGQMLPRPLVRQLECKFQEPIDAFAREDAVLHRDLPFSADKGSSTKAGVFALAVLAHHTEIDIAGRAIGKR